mmetsp:Transcript_20003/g.67658  ORF Transcript_20003/g.67658 Transcript_20003/m.67658 type:complete len:438 (+) Transcript_20003:397-1710(+)
MEARVPLDQPAALLQPRREARREVERAAHRDELERVHVRRRCLRRRLRRTRLRLLGQRVVVDLLERVGRHQREGGARLGRLVGDAAALGEPGRLLDLSDGCPLVGGGDEDGGEQAADRRREPDGEGVVGADDAPEESRHRGLVEREEARKEDVQNDAARPDVRQEAVVSVVSEHLRRNVVWRAASGVQQRARAEPLAAVQGREPKVRDLEHGVLVEEQILRLEVAVADALPVAVLDAADQLAKVGARGGLVEPAGGDDLVEELAAGDELEDDEDAGARGEHLRRSGLWSWGAAREAERRREKAATAVVAAVAALLVAAVAVAALMTEAAAKQRRRQQAERARWASLDQVDDVPLLDHLHHSNLLFDLLAHRLLRHLLLVENLDRHLLSGLSVDCKFDLAKCALAESSSNLVLADPLHHRLLWVQRAQLEPPPALWNL